MTAFLFIPSATGAGRRVNFSNIANLFAEAEMPLPRRDRAAVMRFALVVLILLGAIGDTLLVTRTDTLASCLASGSTARPVATAAGS